MPVNANSYGPYDSGAGANITENFWRDFMGRLAPSAVLRGVNNELNPFGDSTGMQVKVDTGLAWVKGALGEWTSGISVLPIAAVGGIPGGQSRIDRVIMRNDFVNNLMQLDVLTGTASASPLPPALTQSSSVWEVLLGEIGNTANGASAAITNATTTITAGMVLDGRWKMTESGILYHERLLNTAASVLLPAAGAIPAGYRTATLKWRLRADNAVNNNDFWLRLNGDSGANYDIERVQISGSGPSLGGTEALGQNQATVAYVPGTSAPAGYFGRGEAVIEDYGDGGSDKEIYSRSTLKIGNTTGSIFVVSATGTWRTTNVLTTLTALMSAGNMNGWIGVYVNP